MEPDELPLLVNPLFCIPYLLFIPRKSGGIAWASLEPEALGRVKVSRESCFCFLREGERGPEQKGRREEEDEGGKDREGLGDKGVQWGEKKQERRILFPDGAVTISISPILQVFAKYLLFLPGFMGLR